MCSVCDVYICCIWRSITYQKTKFPCLPGTFDRLRDLEKADKMFNHDVKTTKICPKVGDFWLINPSHGYEYLRLAKIIYVKKRRVVIEWWIPTSLSKRVERSGFVSDSRGKYTNTRVNEKWQCSVRLTKLNKNKERFIYRVDQKNLNKYIKNISKDFQYKKYRK